MKGLIIFFGIILVIASNDAVSYQRYQPKLTLRGRVIFPNGPAIPIETDGILTVQLQDVSIADAPAKVIAKSVGKAIRFPMAFAIKYRPEQISEGIRYSLHVSIRNKKNELLYTNDVHIGVTPIGNERTKLIDVPVILVQSIKKPEEKSYKGKWFQFIGMNGAEVVEIIKKETGFRNVVTIPEGSPVTMDLRNDRIRVFVNKMGRVARVPTIA